MPALSLLVCSCNSLRSGRANTLRRPGGSAVHSRYQQETTSAPLASTAFSSAESCPSEERAAQKWEPTIAALKGAFILYKNKLVASLLTRDLPDPIDQMLQLRARQHHATADLQALASQQGIQKFDPSPEDQIRLDRSR